MKVQKFIHLSFLFLALIALVNISALSSPTFNVSVIKSLNEKTGYDPSTKTYKPEYYKWGYMRWNVSIRLVNFKPQYQLVKISPEDIGLSGGKPINSMKLLKNYTIIYKIFKDSPTPVVNEVKFSQGSILPGIDGMSFGSSFEVSSFGEFKVQVLIFEDGILILNEKRNGSIVDHLVLSVGDSYAAGEGAPDVNAYEKSGFLLSGDAKTWITCEGLTLSVMVPTDLGDCRETKEYDWSQPAEWLDENAHRSLKSAHSVAARAMVRKLNERDKGKVFHTLTFMSAATGGATINQGLLNPDPCKDWQKNGQIEDLRRQLDKSGRTPWVLLMTIGGNDIKWVSSLTKATLIPSIFMDFKESANQIKKLDSKYKILNDEIRNKLKPKHILITEYPIDFFSNEDGSSGPSCGIFNALDITTNGLPENIIETITGENIPDLYVASVEENEIGVMKQLGIELNLVIKTSAQKYGWKYVDGINAAFIGHGYCTSDNVTYYTDASTSCKIQGDGDGTLHPNTRGYQIIAEKILEKIPLPGGGIRRPQLGSDVQPPYYSPGF